jgi:predicted AAA+ superfamily ATPase
MIKRYIYHKILEDIKKYHKNVVLYGARQVGKTTLVKSLLVELDEKSLLVNAEESRYLDVLSSKNSDKMRTLIDSFDVICIDEAQRIPDVSINLKILIDSFPEKSFIFTGSSSFELRSIVSESLAGRVMTHTLYPVWTKELMEGTDAGEFAQNEQIPSRLIYGSYPAIINMKETEQKKRELKQIIDTYLLKDMTLFMKLDQEAVVQKLLKLLAYQIGQEISIRELSRTLEVPVAQIQTYLTILERAFIIFFLKGFGSHERKEVTRNPKVYFWDLGIRNALIEKFDDFDLRDDKGNLWENFLIGERMKKNAYTRLFPPASYFWRLYSGSEIDYIERDEQSLSGFEIKWGKKSRIPKGWSQEYPKAGFRLITWDNWIPFVTETD